MSCAAAGDSATNEELSGARSRIATLESQIAELGKDLQRAQAEAARSADALSRAKAGDSTDRELLAKLREERDAIAKKLTAAEANVSTAGEGDCARPRISNAGCKWPSRRCAN